MDDRRKNVGRRIKRARRVAGYTSQKGFAEFIGASETMVAYAETGSDRVGVKTYGLIEDGLGWPEESISTYLDTGDETVFRHAEPEPAPEPEAEADADYTARINRLPADKQVLVDKLITALSADGTDREYGNTQRESEGDGGTVTYLGKAGDSVAGHPNGPRKKNAQ